MLSQEDIRQQYHKGDPYLKFDGVANDKTPRELLPLIDLIRKESEWRKTPLRIRKDNNGRYKPIFINGLCFGFDVLVRADDAQIRAIETGKKCTHYPSGVYPLIVQGCNYNDFAFLSTDVISYCEAKKELNNNNYNEALSQIRNAFELKPQESLYATLFFEIRLEMKDELSIDEELKYFENDIDSTIHSGRVYKWIRFLVQQKKDDKALQLIQLINRLLDEQILGKRKSKIYGSQKSSWYSYKKEQFNKKIEKTKLKLETNLVSTKK